MRTVADLGGSSRRAECASEMSVAAADRAEQRDEAGTRAAASASAGSARSEPGMKSWPFGDGGTAVRLQTA